ncbi:MAG: hypothetical protein ACFFAD_05745 [Candidatus Hermodarchaeota archaeon]
MSKEEKEQETAFKVVAIMQAVAEDLDEAGKKAWRKMLGITDKPENSSEDSEEQDVERTRNTP